jgi:hypothetical protein
MKNSDMPKNDNIRLSSDPNTPIRAKAVLDSALMGIPMTGMQLVFAAMYLALEQPSVYEGYDDVIDYVLESEFIECARRNIGYSLCRISGCVVVDLHPEECCELSWKED